MDKRGGAFSIGAIITAILALIAGLFGGSQPQPTTINSYSNISHAGPDSLYPNPTLTPGDVLTTNASIVCVVGYSSTVRDVPDNLRLKVFADYGIDYSMHADYELDHFISLELGGSNDAKNLFPEAYEPKPGARQKDVVENYLHRQVCVNNMTLEQAQMEISKDWYSIYLQINQ